MSIAGAAAALCFSPRDVHSCIIALSPLRIVGARGRRRRVKDHIPLRKETLWEALSHFIV